MTTYQIINAVRLLVEKMIVEGKSTEAISNAVKLFLEQNNIASALQSEVMSNAQQQIKSLSKTTMRPELRAATQTLYRAMSEGVARIKSQIVSDIESSLQDGLKAGKSSKEMLDVLTYRFGISSGKSQTLIETTARGFDRASTFAKASEAGVERFVYDGPSTNVRPFCENLIKRSKNGESFSLSDIDQLDNGQGLKVIIHCGGYNCRHRWKPLFR